MTDRELLEAAAKAVGIQMEWDRWTSGFICITDAGVDLDSWNSLTDGGDALRLAVKLQILVNPCGYMVAVTDGEVHADEAVSEHQDIHLAARRAIVRAAAEIGSRMR
jgi:hypothetical protein